MKEIRPDHVAVYIRWSTEDQGEGTTLDVQQEACRHYVLSQGWDVRDDLVFIDDGYTGGNLDRPAMTTLRKLVKKGQVDCVVVYKLDRLSRSVIDTVNLVLEEWEDLTYLKSTREPLDTSTPLGKQFFYILISFAEWERSVIRERLFGGRLKRAEQGQSPGMPRAFGFGKDGNNFVVIPAEAAVVREVFEMAAEGHSVRQITVLLNEKGYPTKRGGNWNTSMVSKLLHNPLYAGRLVWGRTRINSRHKKHPEEPRLKRAEPHVVIEDFTEPIVSKDLFDQVQRLMEGNKKIPPAAGGSEHLLSGLLGCGECGGSLQYNANGRWGYYRCARQVNRQGCSAPSIPADTLEASVISEVKTRFASMAKKSARERQEAFLGSVVERLMALENTLDSELQKLTVQEERINRDYREERLSAADRQSLVTAIRNERSNLAAKRQTIDSDLERARALRLAAVERTQRAASLQGFEGLPVPTQKQLLRAALERVTAVRDRETRTTRVTFTWKDEQMDQFPSLALEESDSSR